MVRVCVCGGCVCVSQEHFASIIIQETVFSD